MHKKGSLSLSITAIVVIVIAFVVLGLGLSLTKTIFKGAEAKLPEAFAVTQLDAEPTPDNPITMPDKVELGVNKVKELKVGYYNSDANTHDGVSLSISSCEASSDAARDSINIDTLPTITSIQQNVDPSSSVAYKVILSENKLLGGSNYICTIDAVDQAGVTWESKQFFLYVTS